jgi:hypothetical protein
MKLKTTLLSMSLLSAVGFSGVSAAHTTGAQTLGAALGSTDYFRTVCYSWGNGIHPNAPAGQANGAATAFIATKLAGSSANVVVTALGGGGNGVKYFKVTHNTAVASTYNVDFHCQNAGAVHTGTGETFTGVPANVTPVVDFIRTQNQ